MVIDPLKEKRICFSLEAENIDSNMDVILYLQLNGIGLNIPMEVDINKNVVSGIIPPLKPFKDYLGSNARMIIRAYIGENYYTTFESSVDIMCLVETSLKMILLED